MLCLLLLVLRFAAMTKIFSHDGDTPTLQGTVRKGEAFQLSLKSNPITGSRWELKTPPTLCEYTSRDNFGEFLESETPDTNPWGHQRFYFASKSVGQDRFVLHYERPWSTESGHKLEVFITIIE